MNKQESVGLLNELLTKIRSMSDAEYIERLHRLGIDDSTLNPDDYYTIEDLNFTLPNDLLGSCSGEPCDSWENLATNSNGKLALAA